MLFLRCRPHILSVFCPWRTNFCYLDERGASHLCLDDLFRLNVVGGMSFRINASHVVASASSQARSARNESVRERVATNRTRCDFNNYEKNKNRKLKVFFNVLWFLRVLETYSQAWWEGRTWKVLDELTDHAACGGSTQNVGLPENKITNDNLMLLLQCNSVFFWAGVHFVLARRVATAWTRRESCFEAVGMCAWYRTSLKSSTTQDLT